MPLYEYECAACGHSFEKIQKFSDALVQECPSCGKGPVHKLLSAPAIQFKGTGWYITDYAGKKPVSSQSAQEKADKAGEGAAKSKTATETKPETKTETKPETKSTPGTGTPTT
jgi:putative FmdB family regulatory protein